MRITSRCSTDRFATAAACILMIAGAALDCFAVEPATDLDRFAGLDNLLLAPHAIG